MDDPEDEREERMRLRLGEDLSRRLDAITDRYVVGGACFGAAVGLATGVWIAGAFSYSNASDEMAGKFLGGFFAGTFGFQVGLISGLLYARYKVRKLEKIFPERADSIREYRINQMRLIHRNAH